MQVCRGEDPKGFRVLRFASALTSLTVESRGKYLFASSPLSFDRCVLLVCIAVDWWCAATCDAQAPTEVAFMPSRSNDGPMRRHLSESVSFPALAF